MAACCGPNGPSGFGYRTTAQQIVDHYEGAAKGKVIVITGANGGLGYETARVLALAGAQVFVCSRDGEKSKNAVKELKAALKAAKSGGGKKKEKDQGSVTFVPLNLASLDSVREAAASVLAATPRVDVLINNAGVMGLPKRVETEDGFEMQVGVNHYGHFVFTSHLMPGLVTAGADTGARVVNVSSALHKTSKPFDEDFNSENNYDPWQAYAKSKKANIAFSMEMHKRFEDKSIQVYAIHPGVIGTDLSRDVSCSCLFLCCGAACMKTIPMGAATQTYCAIGEDVEGGHMFQNSNEWDPSSAAIDEEVLEEFWADTEAAVGETFQSGDSLADAAAAAAKSVKGAAKKGLSKVRSAAKAIKGKVSGSNSDNDDGDDDEEESASDGKRRSKKASKKASKGGKKKGKKAADDDEEDDE